jgi:hypothetical protein
MQTVTKELESILETTVPRLRAISETGSKIRSGPEKWSKKEELGHLIDSAVNNHQRFVRMQLNSVLELPGYQQEEWVRLQHYHDRPWPDLIDLWLQYNRHLAVVIRNVNPVALKNTWNSPDGSVDLEFVITDYITHMRHHLDRILSQAA